MICSIYCFNIHKASMCSCVLVFLSSIFNHYVGTNILKICQFKSMLWALWERQPNVMSCCHISAPQLIFSVWFLISSGPPLVPCMPWYIWQRNPCPQTRVFMWRDCGWHDILWFRWISPIRVKNCTKTLGILPIISIFYRSPVAVL